MKRIVFLLVLFALLLSACGIGEPVLFTPTPAYDYSNRDLSTPSSRLVGRWNIMAVTNIEKYFSEINPKTGEGTYTHYEPDSGTVTVMTYRVENEVSDGENLTILLTASDGTELPPVEITSYKNGRSTMMFDYYFVYVDEKTELDPSDMQPTKRPTPTYAVYKVIQDTGLYKDNTVESEQLAILRVGHRLTPANGQSTPYCEDLDAGGGMIIHSCYMKSLVTGQIGWVISKWMTKVP